MIFNKGSELDKQIYKEGEPTWGCKSGVLDIEDVKKFILISEEIILRKGRRAIPDIRELLGDTLVSTQENHSHSSIKRNKIEARDDASPNQDLNVSDSETEDEI